MYSHWSQVCSFLAFSLLNWGCLPEPAGCETISAFLLSQIKWPFLLQSFLPWVASELALCCDHFPFIACPCVFSWNTVHKCDKYTPFEKCCSSSSRQESLPIPFFMVKFTKSVIHSITSLNHGCQTQGTRESSHRHSFKELLNQWPAQMELLSLPPL